MRNALASKLLMTAIFSVIVVNNTLGQMIDNTQAPNTAKAGINKSLLDEIGAGRGDVNTAGSSLYILSRHPVRSPRPGRQVLPRQFTRLPGPGGHEEECVGGINQDHAIAAGVS